MAVIQQNQKTCIFCAERGVNSNEHFFPVWLPSAIKKWDTSDHQIIRVTENLNEGTNSRKSNAKYGALATRKIRCVCAICNNGWMSRSEQAAKPFLEPLIAGKTTPLSDGAIRAIAHWIAIKVIVAEHGDQKTIVTPQEMRTGVMQGIVPDCFNIYIGAHLAQNLGFCRTSHTVGLLPNAFPPDTDGTVPKNVQQVSFTLGRFFTVVNVCLVPSVNLEKISGYIGFYEISKIWPVRKFMFWPPVQPLTASQLNELVTSIHTAVGGSPLSAMN